MSIFSCLEEVTINESDEFFVWNMRKGQQQTGGRRPVCGRGVLSPLFPCSLQPSVGAWLKVTSNVTTVVYLVKNMRKRVTTKSVIQGGRGSSGKQVHYGLTTHRLRSTAGS